jgi:hypothetical protein
MEVWDDAFRQIVTVLVGNRLLATPTTHRGMVSGAIRASKQTAPLHGSSPLIR